MKTNHTRPRSRLTEERSPQIAIGHTTTLHEETTLPAVTVTSTLEPAELALNKCDSALQKLEASCCEPGRSPRMASLAETLGAARLSLSHIVDEDTARLAIDLLENAGAQIGHLQIGCCALDRMPLYAEMLVELTKAQRAVTKARDLGH